MYDVYRADYAKGAFCSVIGGACASGESMENAFFQNPASLTRSDNEWGFDADYNQSSSLEPGMKGENAVGETQYLAGIGTRKGNFGIGLGIFGRTTSVSSQVTIFDDQGINQKFPLQTNSTHLEFNLPVSYRYQNFNFGLALVGAYTDFSLNTAGRSLEVRKSGVNFGFALGMITRLSPKVRFGSWFRSSLTNYASISIDQDFPASTLHYNEDLAIHTPWIMAAGFALQTGIKSEWSAGLHLIGDTQNGLQLTYDTFSTALGDRGVRAKGRYVSLEPRMGYKTPWPWIEQDKGTLLFGAYFEPSRWDGISGRLHETFGIAHKTFEFAEFMVGGDLAKDFFQIFLTFR